MDWSSNPLLETAQALGRRWSQANPGIRPLPPLLFLTDPDRTPEPWRQAERLPQGAGVVLRWFDRPDTETVGRRLRDICRERGLTFLVGADPDLAEHLDSNGVHLPDRMLSKAPGLRLRNPKWLITGAAHSADALTRGAEFALDAALLSPVFASASPSAGQAIGAEDFTRIVGGAGLPVYALGGVDAVNAPRLLDSGACGLAAIGAIGREENGAA